MRIGHGFDAHRFGPGDHVMIGGVALPHHQGLVAHSDGDVLIHAICDAILGAAALGDIGRHFPDSDELWKDANSRLLLRKVVSSVLDSGWRVVNLDSTVIAQAPRLGGHIEAMRENLAADLQVDRMQVNVKATTTEKMGFTGREEGIAA
ncbi:MAG TPA: 2-C-methyl-D-erythritol 2,4-cyclodiphosphate synthase, partial [Chromatiaceae bacterium]|nr:2-C-methyl-D-erythritol 2,4-cyclodiphosphate synthase [Chromatiaceae bacterium]